MKINNHLLFNNNNQQVPFKNTPNKGKKFLGLQYLVMHYTAVTKAAGSISWFMDKNAEASAHLLIDRDGSITQFAPFDTITWHAGKSQLNGLSGLNQYSIGIELVNGGRLKKVDNQFVCPVDQKIVNSNDVVFAKHKNETEPNFWHNYTTQQIEVATEVAALLVKTYGLKDVVGHDDIAPFRKSDPGPAFAMTSFRAKAMGRKDETIDNYTTTTAVNIRKGPGTDFLTVTDALPTNTKVLVLKREGNWSFVEVVGKVHGLNDVEGWVSSKFLGK